MPVKIVTITEDNANQRIDNFLLTECKGVPKTRIYKAIRKGEVRVNQKRIKPEHRLTPGDLVRVPPLRMSTESKIKVKASGHILEKIEQSILLETKELLVINKPAGIPVHGGTGIKTGLIEGLRELRPNCKFLELVHRLDRETSGCLLVAKKRAVLVALHDQLLNKKVRKHYHALVKGRWQGDQVKVKQPLKKNHLASGEGIVVISPEGKPSETIFRPLIKFKEATLVEAIPITGRTHQIRVHATFLGHPIVGDDKYGDKAFNKQMRQKGIKRLFLHSASITCKLVQPQELLIGVCALVEQELKNSLKGFARIK